MDSLSQVVGRLSKAYVAFQEAKAAFEGKKSKKDPTTGVKQEFLNEATKEVASQTLAAKSVVVEVPSREEAESAALRRNPRWRVVDARPQKKGWQVLLEEDPALKEFSYVDKDNKLVWRKEIADGSPYLDEEELQDKDWKLWLKVSKMERVFKGIDELSPEELAQIEQYIYPGKPIVKLAAPRKAKKEELE